MQAPMQNWSQRCRNAVIDAQTRDGHVYVLSPAPRCRCRSCSAAPGAAFVGWPCKTRRTCSRESTPSTRPWATCTQKEHSVSCCTAAAPSPRRARRRPVSGRSSEWNMAPSSGFWAWSCCVRSFACRAMSAAAPIEAAPPSFSFFPVSHRQRRPWPRFAAFFLAFAAALFSQSPGGLSDVVGVRRCCHQILFVKGPYSSCNACSPNSEIAF